MAYNTGNPIGSTDARDLYDNAENLDKATNGTPAAWTDRLGFVRKSFAGMEDDFQAFLLASGYEDLGTYAGAMVITARNQIFVHDGEYYRAAAPTVLPYTTTGTWSTDDQDFVPIGDAALRQDIAEIADMTIGYYRNAVNCNQFGGLAAALADSDTIGKTIVVTDAQAINASVAVTGRSLSVEYGGLLTIAAGQTLTINGAFSAGNYQVFAGSGTVTGLRDRKKIWFDGVTDEQNFSVLSVGPPYAAYTPQPLMVSGPDPGISIWATNDNTGAEAYIAGFVKDASGTYQKIGATAWQFTDPNTINGFASWNTHETYFSGGTTHDEYSIAAWAKHGVSVFPSDLSASSAPGDKTFMVNGNIASTLGYSVQPNVVGVVEAMTARNANNNAASSVRYTLGNDASIVGATITLQSSAATIPNALVVQNEFNAPLILGQNGAEVIRLSAGRVMINLSGMPVFADNTAAASLSTGTIYRTSTGQLMVRY